MHRKDIEENCEGAFPTFPPLKAGSCLNATLREKEKSKNQEAFKASRSLHQSRCRKREEEWGEGGSEEKMQLLNAEKLVGCPEYLLNLTTSELDLHKGF